MKKPTIHIVKVGGALLEDAPQRKALLDHFASLKGLKVLVHGGGREATALADQLGSPARLIEGRRITDAGQLRIALMVYAGRVNKQLVADLQAQSCQALGLSGADGDLIRAIKRPVGEIDFGWVGDVQKVNTPFLTQLLEWGLCPVICALTHDGEGQMLNTNADTIASAIACALSSTHETRLMYCFELPGVLRTMEDKDSVIPQIDEEELPVLLSQGIISKGMLPKLQAGFQACRAGVGSVQIGNFTMLAGTRSAGTRLFIPSPKKTDTL